MNRILKSEFYEEAVVLTKKLKTFSKIEYEGFDPIISAWKYMFRNRKHLVLAENVFGHMMSPGDLIFQHASHRSVCIGVYLFSKDGYDKSIVFSNGTSQLMHRKWVYFDAYGSFSHSVPFHIEDLGKNQDADDKREELGELMLETSQLIKKIIVLDEL